MKKVSAYKRKVNLAISVSNKVKIAFLQRCKSLDLDKNVVAEELFRDFVNKTK